MAPSKLTQLGWLAAGILLVGLASLQASADQEPPGPDALVARQPPPQPQQQPNSPAQTARSKFKVSQLFNFETFKKLFHKSYKSLVEKSARLMYFMSRAFRAHASALDYKHSDSSYYLAINHMSDQSPAELESMTNRELLAASQTSTLDELMGMPELAPEPEPEPDHGLEHGLEHETALASQPERQGAELRRMRRSLRTGPADEPTLKGPFKRLTWDLDLAVAPLKGAASESSVPSAAFAAAAAPDEVFFDHSREGCMLSPRNQAKCGSCYAFAAVAYFEWLHCKKTLDLVALSEQFIIDCGPGHLGGLNGCNGGTLSGASEFVGNFGLEARANYVYRARNDICPYASETPLKSTGYLKVRNLERGSVVHMSHWPAYIKRAPMLIMMSTSGQPSFMEYGGGVYDGLTCHERQTDHTMLLVGHGREDGQEYWLIRNSYGADWGEGGYMKLSKRAKCIHPSAGYLPGTRDGGRKLEARPVSNKAHEKARVRERYATQMAHALETWKI